MKQVTADYLAKRRYWGSVAEGYNRWRVSSPLRHFIWTREFQLLERVVREHIKESSTILDAPTGTGRFLPLLRNLGHRTTGVDISSDMLKVQKTVSGKVRTPVVQGDCEALPFRDRSFDYIISLRFLGHVPPEARVRVLQEFRRVANKGVIVGFPVVNPFTTLKFELGNLRYRLKNGKKRPWWPATPRSLSQEMDSAGLKIEHEAKLLGPFSQIVFLYLTRTSSCAFSAKSTHREFHLVSA